jgi:hypothetical protein
MKYKAILVGEKQEPGKYPLVKQIFGDTLKECENWAKEILKGTLPPIIVEIYEMKWERIGIRYRIIEPHNSPPPYASKLESQKDVE